MNQLIVVFLPLSDCHFVMKIFAKNNVFSRGSFVHRSHVFRSCEDREKGSTSFPWLFSFHVCRERNPEKEPGPGTVFPCCSSTAGFPRVAEKLESHGI